MVLVVLVMGGDIGVRVPRLCLYKHIIILATRERRYGVSMKLMYEEGREGEAGGL